MDSLLVLFLYVHVCGGVSLYLYLYMCLYLWEGAVCTRVHGHALLGREGESTHVPQPR